MAAALARGSDSEILRNHPALTFRNGPYSYTVRQENSYPVYTVTDGKQTISVPIAWAFGLGAAGQTYVFERDGKWYESRVSYYREVGGLDLTLGARNALPQNLEDAAGRQMSPKDAAACFGCHSDGGARGARLTLDTIVPGVQCESCHPGAVRHEAGVRSGDAKAAIARLGALGAEEISELCGRCHRTWSDIATNGPRGVENVRFQGYRLTNSKCYNVSDRRISCVACHNPHREIERTSAAYDSKCTACHGRTARTCSTGKRDCAGCHMPKFEIPGSHHRFSDHQIRIVKANETYPN
jgi:hypothetical protein